MRSLSLDPHDLRGSGARVREVRRVLRGRRSRANAGEVSYRAYMAVMLAIVVAAPLVRIGLLWLTDLSFAGEAFGLAPALTAVTALLALAGAQGGPAYAGLARVDLLFTTALPRWCLLARPVTRGLITGAAVGVFAGAMVAVARAMHDDSNLALALALLVAGAALGLFAALAMLIGQLGRRIRWTLAGTLSILAFVQLLWGLGIGPWSLGAWVVFAGPGDALDLLLGPTLTLLCALLLAGFASRIAALLRWESLREQAARWDVIHVTAATGDPKVALDRMGAPVWVGRRWRLRGARSPTSMIVRRDFLGMLRTPARSLLGLLGVIAALGLWCGVFGIDPLGSPVVGEVTRAQDPDLLRAAVLGGLAVLTASLSLQPWCRGLVAAAEGVGSPPLLPLSPQGLLARHLLAPFMLATLVSTLGVALLAISVDVTALELWGVAVTSVVLFASALTLRLLAALKGSIPLQLLAPIPTPVGDASGITVALWMLDGPLVAALLGALLGALWAAGMASGVALLWAGIVSIAMVAGLLLRVRARLTQ